MGFADVDVGYAPDGCLLRPSSDEPASAANVGVPISKVIATLTTQPDAVCITVSPDSGTVYVANGISNNVTVIDATNNYNVKATIAGLYADYYLTLSGDGKPCMCPMLLGLGPFQ